MIVWKPCKGYRRHRTPGRARRRAGCGPPADSRGTVPTAPGPTTSAVKPSSRGQTKFPWSNQVSLVKPSFPGQTASGGAPRKARPQGSRRMHWMAEPTNPTAGPARGGRSDKEESACGPTGCVGPGAGGGGRGGGAGGRGRACGPTEGG